MLLVAILTVERSQLDAFRDYEHRAAQIMARYGGRIERALVLPGSVQGDRETPVSTFRELHVVAFPDAAAYTAYRADAHLALLAPLRAACIVASEVWPAEEGPRY